MSFLEHTRVLDLGGDWGGLPGQILAQMGAEVIRVEPPGGDAARRRAPVAGGASLPWAAFNMSKRSVTADLNTPAGRALLLDLVAGAQAVIESHRPGQLEAFGLSAEHLITVHPGLVVTSLTAFGQCGPRVAEHASDTTVMALSGLMAVTGFAGLPPLRLGFDQITSLGGLQAALGTLIALYARASDGLGQHVDVSVLDAARLANYREPLRWEFQRAVETRRGNVARRGRGGFTSNVWRCRDGWVTWSASDDPKRARSFFDAAHAKGMALDWQDHNFAAELPADMDQSRIDALEAAIAPFFELYSRNELEEMAREKGWILIAFLDMAEARSQPQLGARGFWTEENLGQLCIPVPAFPFRASADQPRHRGPPPEPGQDNATIYSELGRSPEDIARLKAEGVI